MKQKFLPIIALLLMAATGAWADSFSADAYAANATLNGVSVSTDQTVTINEGVTVTVNNGLSIQSNATLTVTGGGTLVVNGNNGANGQDEQETVDPLTGELVMVKATPGGNGYSGIVIDNGGNLIISNATIIAVGGKGGQGGKIEDESFAANGADGNGFASFPAIEGAVMSYSTNGTDYTEYASGDKTLYRYMKAVKVGPTTYSVTLAEGTEDATNWQAKVGNDELQALPLTGLTGDGTETVTITYNGTKRVKSVTAVKKAAAPSVPDGAISGVFSVSATKKVYFSKGNLRYASGAWSFFDNQYDYYASYSEDAWDKFGWSTSATTYGMNTSDQNSTYSGDFVDWGATMGTGWFTLSSDELTYLFNTRSASTVNNTADGRYAKAKVNDVQGVILFPDTYTHPDGVTAPVGVNATGDTGWNGNNYSSADWTKMESAGCVFLPAAGYRYGSSVYNAGTHGYFWPATPNSTDYAYRMRFYSGGLYPAGSYASRFSGYSVRLVREVTE